MSHRTALASLVQTKMNAARQRIDEAVSQTNDVAEQANTKAQMLGDYQLFFQGAREALEAVGLAGDDLRPVILVEKAILSEIEAEQNRAMLEAELRGD